MAARDLPLPVLVATHARTGAAPAPLRTVRVRDAAEVRRLCAAAAVGVVPRRSPGGFPMKLLNYLEASLPVVARRGVADVLEPERSACLLEPKATPAELGAAVRELLENPQRAARLGRAGRLLLGKRLAWSSLAARTWPLLEAVSGSRASEA